MCTGFQTVLGNVPQLVTIVAGLRWVLGLHMIQVHGLWVCSWFAAGGRGHGGVSGGWGRGRWRGGGHWGDGGGGGGCGHGLMGGWRNEWPPSGCHDKRLMPPLK